MSRRCGIGRDPTGHLADSQISDSLHELQRSIHTASRPGCVCPLGRPPPTVVARAVFCPKQPPTALTGASLALLSDLGVASAQRACASRRQKPALPPGANAPRVRAMLPIPLIGATMEYSSMRPFFEALEEARERLRADHRGEDPGWSAFCLSGRWPAT